MKNKAFWIVLIIAVALVAALWVVRGRNNKPSTENLPPGSPADRPTLNY